MRVAFLAAAGGAAFWAAPAAAEVVQLSGTAFVQQCPCTAGIGSATVENGVLTPDGPSTYYAQVPHDGGRVCRLTAYYRDVNDLEEMTVTLFKKVAEVGDPIDREPLRVASAKSKAGVVQTVRQVSTAKVKNANLSGLGQFLYVQVDFQNINMDLVGVEVQIEKNGCPQ